MEHLVLSLYVISGSLGAATIIVVLLAYLRWRHTYYWRFALFIVSMTLILQAEAMKTYGNAAAHPPTIVLRILVTFMVVAGTGLLGWAIPAFAFRLSRQEQPLALKVFHVCLAITLGGLGAFKELGGWSPWPDIHYLSLLVVYAYGSLVLWHGLSRVRSPSTVFLARSFLIRNAALAIPGVAQLVLWNMSFLPESLSYPFVQIAYYLWTVVNFLRFATIFLFGSEQILSPVPPKEFLRRFGISPRESDIISMISQGYNNKKIGQDLFISAVTVKNHIYHIYRKTGVVNKVQLLNLMNETAHNGSESDSADPDRSVENSGRHGDPEGVIREHKNDIPKNSRLSH